LTLLSLYCLQDIVRRDWTIGFRRDLTTHSKGSRRGGIEFSANQIRLGLNRSRNLNAKISNKRHANIQGRTKILTWDFCLRWARCLGMTFFGATSMKGSILSFEKSGLPNWTASAQTASQSSSCSLKSNSFCWMFEHYSEAPITRREYLRSPWSPSCQ